MTSSQDQRPDRRYLRMPFEKNPDKPLEVRIKQKLVYDCFKLEPKDTTRSEALYDDLDNEVVQEQSKFLGSGSLVRQVLEDISGQMPLKIKLPSDRGRHDLYVSVLVPKRVFDGKVEEKCPVHVRFHGGGFCTGSPDYSPWFPYHLRHLLLDANAITLLPSYCKLPEHNGKELTDDVGRFWEWFQGETFESDVKTKCPNVKMNTSNLLVSGDSAGGFLAAWSWLTQPNLRIKALYLQYPMLRAYARHGTYKYRDETPDDKVVGNWVANLLKRIEGKEKFPIRVNSDPPLGMDAAYALSSTAIACVRDENSQRQRISCWKYIFRFPDIFDCLEALFKKNTNIKIPDWYTKYENGQVTRNDNWKDIQKGVEKNGPIKQSTVPWECSTNSVNIGPSADRYKLELQETLSGLALEMPQYCPAMFITHGDQDTNVSVNDSLRFKHLVLALFPKEEDKVWLKEKMGEGHAFDYRLGEWSEKWTWMQGVKNDIVSHWLAGNDAEIFRVQKRQEMAPLLRSGENRTAFDIFADDDDDKANLDEGKLAKIYDEIEKSYKDRGTSTVERCNAYIEDNWEEIKSQITAKGKQRAGP